ncbi:MAG: hypothetical protein QF781_06490 [Phycisphaerales bacterium]|nr:hypothetical protein [Phycisphaerales bacterium]
MRTLPTAAAAAGVVLCAGTALAGMQRIDYRLVGTNLVDTGGFNWTVDVIAVLDADNRLDAVAGNGDQQKLITSSGGFYQNPLCGGTSANNNEGFWGMQPSMEFDSFVTIGSMSSTDNELQTIGIDFTSFEAGGDLWTDNGTWFIIPTEPQGEAISQDTHSCDTADGVTIARLTILGENSLVTFEALFQGRDELYVTWQHTDTLDITYDAILDADCNDNGVRDGCDLADGTLHDDNGNGIPDECETIDCNENGVPDDEDIANGTSLDCDANGIPDECQAEDDCNGDLIPDQCQSLTDCNEDGIADECQELTDCNEDGVPDDCQELPDFDGNGIPDSCESWNVYNATQNLTYDEIDLAINASNDGDFLYGQNDHIENVDLIDFDGHDVRLTAIDDDFSQAANQTMTLASGVRVDGGMYSSFNGTVHSGDDGSATLAAGTDVYFNEGSLLNVRNGGGVSIEAGIATSFNGTIMVQSNGTLESNAGLPTSGTMVTIGSALVMADVYNHGSLSTAGTFVGYVGNYAAGTMTVNDETMIVGDLYNENLITVNRGPLYVIGNITNDGTILGEVDNGPGFAGGDEPAAGDGFRVSGDYIAGASASLYMAHENWQMAVGGNVDIAINDHDRFIMDEATLAMTGESGSVQSLEAMSLDVGSSTIGIDRTLDGHFPLGVLVIEAGTEVTVVDNHDNAGGNETMYVKHLVIEAGSVFVTGDRTIWYETVDNNGTVIGDIDVIKEPCPGDGDGDGEVDIDDLLTVIGNFTCTGICDGDVDGNGIVDINDLLTVIGNFGPCS